MVETLYGVCHGKDITTNGRQIAGFELTPGKELISELLALPQNTSVGIEHTPELGKKFEVDGALLNTYGSLYWEEIRKICEQKNLNVVYLEDFATYKKYTRELMKQNKLERNLRDYMESSNQNPTDIDEDARKLIREAYGASVQAEYVYVVEREQKMLDKIAEQKPQVVILGKGHTDYLMLSPKEFISRKIPLGKYTIEEGDFAPLQWTQEQPHLIRNPLPDKRELLDRELLIRRYRAVTEGRIMPKGTPSYIRTWDVVIPARGLFEVYLDKKYAIHGRIEDALGTADFGGQITKNNATFFKRYNRSKSSNEAAEGYVTYNADGANGLLYMGEFEVPSTYADDKKMPFVMRKYSETVKLNLV